MTKLTSSRWVLKFASVALASTILSPRMALAQVVGSPDEVALARTGLFTRDQNISVLDRPRPDYAPLGIALGSFKIQPQLDSSIEYNDNIYAVPSQTTADEIFHISPSAIATSDWNRNMLQFSARGSFNEYASHSSEDANNYALSTTGRWDVADALGLAGGASVQQNSESRTSPNSPTIARNPITYELESAFVVGAYSLSRVRLSARVDYSNFDYDNGVTSAGAPVYQKDRDYGIVSGTFRAEYATLPGASIFANLVVNHQQNYNLLSTDASRTGSGYEMTVGSNFDVTRLIRGEVFVGYVEQDFDDSRYKTVSGVSVRGYVEYFPTQLTTVTLSSSRVPVDSVIIGAGAYLDTAVTLRVDHELLRNFLLFGSVGYENDDYSGIHRTDDRNIESVGATYLMNRRVGLNLTYLHSQNRSSGDLAGLSYNINSLVAGITLRY